MSDSPLRRELRQKITDAESNDDQKQLSLLRLISTAVQVKDRTARDRQLTEMDDAAIRSMIVDMIAQRADEIDQAERNGRIEDAEQERAEVSILETFLPSSCEDAELQAVIHEVIDDLQATRLTDIGDVMNALSERLEDRFNLQHAKDCACSQLKARSHGG